MRRWIAGLEPKALPFALVCNILTLLMGVSIATVLVAVSYTHLTLPTIYSV